jgi:hypothetical protein
MMPRATSNQWIDVTDRPSNQWIDVTDRPSNQWIDVTDRPSNQWIDVTDRPSNQWIDVTTDMDDVVVQKRSAHQQHEDAQSQQKTDEHENDREIYVGINLLHD